MPSQQLVAEEFLLDPEGVSAAFLRIGRRCICRRLKKGASSRNQFRRLDVDEAWVVAFFCLIT